MHTPLILIMALIKCWLQSCDIKGHLYTLFYCFFYSSNWLSQFFSIVVMLLLSFSHGIWIEHNIHYTQIMKYNQKTISSSCYFTHQNQSQWQLANITRPNQLEETFYITVTHLQNIVRLPLWWKLLRYQAQHSLIS